MTLETEVAALTTATTDLLNEVIDNKDTLTNKVAASAASATASENARDASFVARDGADASKDLAYAYSQDAASAVAYQDLAAIREALSTDTVVDVFIYDTSKDSDGGLWRERCSDLSWYNEPLNTATRGATRKFPAGVGIVAEASTVTFFDLTAGGFPMWMVFNITSLHGSYLQSGGCTSVSAMNGILTVGLSSVGLSCINFLMDTCYRYKSNYITIGGLNTGNFQQRNASNDFIQTEERGLLVNDAVNDIALTVRDDAPIDPKTGLKVPTIAAATNGGISVINGPAGVDTVVDITNGTSRFYAISALPEKFITYDINRKEIVEMGYPLSDYNIITSSDHQVYDQSSIPAIYTTNGHGHNTSYLQYLSKNLVALAKIETGNINTGLTLLAENPESPADGMTNFITKDWQSGWMQGDIKGAWLADTEVGDLDGTELVVNGTFDSDTSGWTDVSIGTATFEYFNNSVRLNRSADILNISKGSQSFSTIPGTRYLVNFDVTAEGSAVAKFRVSTSEGGSDVLDYTSEDGFNSVTFVAVGSVTYINIYPNTTTVTGVIVDNVSITEAVPDRSVNNKALAVKGTITRTPVNTNSELVAYSGFSATDYIEQPYNPDLDFGTGDFSIMGWVNLPSSTNTEYILYRSGAGAIQPRFYINCGYGLISLEIKDGTTTERVTATTNIRGRGYIFFCARRVGRVLSVSVNAVEEDTLISTGVDITNLTGSLRLGVRQDGLYPLTGSIALLRIGAGAPSDEQIAKIYNDEKKLFEANAKCTLPANNVQALDYDKTTDLLMIGTDMGACKFKGLVNVEQDVGVETVGGELVVNGGFDSDVAGWTNQGNWVWDSSGRAYHPLSDVFNMLLAPVAFEIGSSYFISFTLDNVSGTSLRCQVRRADLSPVANPQYPAEDESGQYSFIYTVSEESAYLAFGRNSAGVDVEAYIDNVSIYELTDESITDLDIKSVSINKGANLIGTDSGAFGYSPALNLREELAKDSKVYGFEQTPNWFESIGEDTFKIPYGHKPFSLYEGGLLKREGEAEDYTVTYDGVNYSIQFPPGAGPSHAGMEFCCFTTRSI